MTPRAVVPHMVSRRAWHTGYRMKRRWLRVGSCLILAALTVSPAVVLAGHAAAGPTPNPAPRSAPARASRSTPRPPWPPSTPSLTGVQGVTPAVPPSAVPPSRPAAATVSSAARPAGRGSPTAAQPGIRERIAWCESRNNPHAVNKTSGASGTYQFMRGTFQAVTGLPGDAADYPEAVQDAAFDALYAVSGTAPWASSRSCWQ